MRKPHTRSFEFIENVIRGLLRNAEIKWINEESLYIRTDSQSITIPFGRDHLDDLEFVLEGNQPVRYSNGLKNDVCLGIYVAIGREGMIPGFKISPALLNINQDWRPSRISIVQFDADVARDLYDGLVELRNSLRTLLASNLEVPEIESEVNVLQDLIGFYEKHGHLNDRDVGPESLSYIKAAALCWIHRLERKKSQTASDRIKLAYDKKIYEIVQEFWISRAYKRIPLPPAVDDHLAHEKMPVPAPPEHRSHIDIGQALEQIDVRLRDRWLGAWAALQSDNPDRVSQAANSMVEVLDQVIDRVRGSKEFKDYLAARFPEQEKVVLATRKWITEVKDGLQRVKHHPVEQSSELAQDLMHQAEWLISILTRT